ncbi:MAG: hypothetical protein JWM95_3509 [Gemmatimonadetes bacterium]|nr:hypothetical protein [Gemmatimonadota bacterium]
MVRDTRTDGEVDVAVVIVNYRTPALTIDCVRSVFQSSAVTVHVVIVDNASADDSVEQFHARFAVEPRVTVIARSTNDGYTGGNNVGLEHARGLGARFALVLNSDTVVAPDCLSHLVAAMDKEPRVALACPRIFYGDAPELLWFGGGVFSPWRGRAVHVGHRRPAAEGWQLARDLPFATGCALLLRFSACHPPVFDTTLFGYAEDLDLCLRIRVAGQRILYVPEADVWHYDASSYRVSGGQSLRSYLSTRNQLRVVLRHAQWYQWPVVVPMLAVNVVGRFFAIAVRNGDARAAGAVLLGAWHAVSGGHHAIEGVRSGDDDGSRAHTD